MKKLVKELKGIRRPIPKPTKVIDSKKKKILEKIIAEEVKNSKLDEG